MIGLFDQNNKNSLQKRIPSKLSPTLATRLIFRHYKLKIPQLIKKYILFTKKEKWCFNYNATHKDTETVLNTYICS